MAPLHSTATAARRAWLTAAGVGLFGTAVVGLLAQQGLARESKPSPAAAKAAVGSFALLDQEGKLRKGSEFQQKPVLVLVFTGTSCPISNSYAEPLTRLAEKYAARGVQVLGVNANPDEPWSEVARHAKEYRFGFPVLKDDRQLLVEALDPAVTPEAFVLDASRTVRYRGRIDNAYASRTQKRKVVTSQDLDAAITAVLAGKKPPAERTQAFGCAIVRRSAPSPAGGPVTFHRDVAGILQDNCQSCHRPGQVAPFSLLTYGEARSWGQEIKAFTASRQMPPWKAEPGHGDFEGARRLTDEQIRTLAAWVDGGMPEGDPAQAPPAKRWSSDWMLGTPDLVLSMPEEHEVAATGKDEFRCFVLPTNLSEDRQVVGIEVRPGNPRVLHHVLNFVDTSGQGRRLDARDPKPGYDSGPGGVGFFPSGALGGWAPGNMPRRLPGETYMVLPKGSDLVIQVHYHKTGKPEKDRTSIGLYFAKEPRSKRLRTIPLTNLRIDIPPNEPRHQVTATMRVPFDAQAWSITPHMHLLGREMRVTATLPDGTKKDMVWIKDWDYRWQDTYIYRQPVALPRGTQLDLVAHFDNSAANPLNPNNPPQRVTFGEETTDEMCFAFIEFTLDREPPAAAGGFNPGRFFGGGRPR